HFLFDSDRKLNADPQVVTGTQLGKQLRPETIPELAGDGPYQAKGPGFGNRFGFHAGFLSFRGYRFRGWDWFRWDFFQSSFLRLAFQGLGFRLGEQEDVGIEADFFGTDVLSVPKALVRAIGVQAGGQAEVALLNELKNLSPEG